MRRITSVVLLAAALALPATAQAAVTIGSNLASAANGNVCGAADCTAVNTTLTSDVASDGLTSPVNGTVTSWRFVSASATNTVSLRVLRPAGGNAFTGAGTSAAVTSAGGLNGPFATSLPIQAGDHIGLNVSNGAIVMNNTVVATQLYWTMPQLADSSTRPSTGAVNQEVLVQATIDPNAVAGGGGAGSAAGATFGAITRNKKKGTARVSVHVPNPGQLAFSGTGIKASGPPSVAAAGDIQVTVKASGKKRKKLNRKGKVGVSLTMTFTPTGGSAGSASTSFKLVKKHKK